MNDIILHHYPQSPVSEKVRIAFGLKGLAWRSVTVPRLPPKPDLMPLTGGYRRAPVMQIGADIYCDTQCILRALEQRFPDPSFFPEGNPGLVWALSRWTDGELLDLAVRLVLGAGAESLPADFARDRGRLYLGPDQTVGDLKADLPNIIGQLRAAFAWIESSIERNGGFVLGPQPSLADALVYYLAWFIRGRWPQGPSFLAQFPALVSWESKLRDREHGDVAAMESTEALDIAQRSETVTTEGDDAEDPQGLRCGDRLAVVPAVDGGDPVVHGRLRYADRETVVLIHEHARVGQVCLHFPRVGYRITRA
ncbi:glutathione S-transferase family protein [Pelagibius litoralis]|uniref:Glutathione S-transferase family protein n=1 Tax=Pelagibius litoralis TaxID=374515 RepID=A0A967EYX3_9PROT|nr:glutathione S-transferase family protein [Pelagibius litoralis]NIA69962.1 glutathione S-transferase family protein [Pelagibius litoralis]